ncbi:MAG: hypothetical protein UY76_C0021G0003 [Candidatus Uhrbacteria bacterium GW2011_GWA2_52_8d]|uniref:Uncharacterized protein n=1 Tax=Candidatus Uhrbacteria bacterium GW2011_GWA2_52_8d TaxID=1618979 RepID=A0A0G1ZWB2_9BACT|nr:MAG: hypothetical protein UY76_C0021G0003 [Candidatus Uhrbacteria bacterium GW2011_GWA2_52_8d]
MSLLCHGGGGRRQVAGPWLQLVHVAGNGSMGVVLANRPQDRDTAETQDVLDAHHVEVHQADILAPGRPADPDIVLGRKRQVVVVHGHGVHLPVDHVVAIAVPVSQDKADWLAWRSRDQAHGNPVVVGDRGPLGPVAATTLLGARLIESPNPQRVAALFGGVVHRDRDLAGGSGMVRALRVSKGEEGENEEENGHAHSYSVSRSSAVLASSAAQAACWATVQGRPSGQGTIP